MSFNPLRLIDKFDDIIYRPVDTFCKWAEQPMKQKEHERKLEIQRNNYAHELAKQELAARHELDKERHQQELESKRLQLEQERNLAFSKAQIELQKLENDEDLRKDKVLRESVVAYHRELVKLGTFAVKQSGNTLLSLTRQADAFIDERYTQLTTFQKETRAELRQEIKQIKSDFADDPDLQRELIGMTTDNIKSILDQATEFIRGLNTIKENLNSSISRLNDRSDALLQAKQQDLIELGKAATPSGFRSSRLDEQPKQKQLK